MHTQNQSTSTINESKYNEEKLKIAIQLLYLFSSFPSSYLKVRNIFDRSYPSKKEFENYSVEILQAISNINQMSFFKRKISNTFIVHGLKHKNEIFLEIMAISFAYVHADKLCINRSILGNELTELFY